MSTDDDEDELYQAFLESRDARFIAPAENDVPSVEFLDGGEKQEWRIWQGYLDASFFLLKEALRQSPSASNLIFPAMFNLRHGIEVSLKWHIRYAGGPACAGHKLRVLFETLKNTVNEPDDALLCYLSSIISELEPIDPRSVAFRYSTELDGSLIEIKPSKWDLRRLYFVVSDLSICFDILSSRIDHSNFEDS
jgi:HEPN domain-containing protein